MLTSHAPVRQGGRALKTTPHRSSPESSLLIRAHLVKLPFRTGPSSRHEGGLPLTPQRLPAEASVLVRARSTAVTLHGWLILDALSPMARGALDAT
jgi:hypothetical protein